MAGDRMEIERAFWVHGLYAVAGVDEAGRGPLAGPVVAAAVILPQEWSAPGLRDSKCLTADQRDRFFDQICSHALAWHVAMADEKEIDDINILQAALKAMGRAVEGLSLRPDHVLVDGNQIIPGILMEQTAFVKGDQRSRCIAAASVLAKVTRDRFMIQMDTAFPEYGFARHKGYATRDHIRAIEKYGLSPCHRRSFQIRGWVDEK